MEDLIVIEGSGTWVWTWNSPRVNSSPWGFLVSAMKDLQEEQIPECGQLERLGTRGYLNLEFEK